jgi:hypothetical protein
MTGSIIVAALARYAAALPAGSGGTTQLDGEHSDAASIEVTEPVTGRGTAHG